MSSCYRCNGSGRCVNCVCVKAGDACTNCMPQRRGNCRNSITNRSDLRDSSAVVSQATVPVQPSPSPIPQQQLEIQSGVPLPPFTPMAQSTASTITSQLVSPTTPDTADVTTIPDLPPYPPLRDLSLTMGAQDAAEFSHQVSEAYEEIVHFSPNLLEVPMGNTGWTFIGMLSTLFHAFGNDSLGSADYAMKAAMVMQQLLLEKPVGKLTFAVSMECLQRRIASWNKGAVRELYSAKAPPSSTSSPNIEVAIADETVLQPTQHASLRLTSSRANCQLPSVSSPLIRVEAYLTWMTSLERRQSERCCAVNILLLSQLPPRHSSKGNLQRNPTQCYSPAWTGLPYVAPPKHWRCSRTVRHGC